MENEEGYADNENGHEIPEGEENGYEDDENGGNNVQEDENFDENGQPFEPEYNDPVMQDNMLHQENRPKYKSA